jgi:[histone H3]-lysine9 N-trimethyltransferase SUV39H
VPLDSETVKVLIPKDPPIGCQCKDCNEEMENCDAALADFDFAYSSKVVNGKKEKLLQLEHGKPVYECNKSCMCPSSCLNRVLQNGSMIKLKIFKTKNMGWGVKAMEPIPQGKFVCEYIGEVITRYNLFCTQQ